MAVGLTGECPTQKIRLNGHLLDALIDTGSEVTTVTNAWVKKHLGEEVLRPSHVRLRAVNGADVPYSGILVAAIEIYGQKMTDVPILVVNDPSEASTAERKKKVPALIGMNVISSAKRESLPGFLQAVIQQVQVEDDKIRVARAATDTVIRVHSLLTVRVTSSNQPSGHLLATHLSKLLPLSLIHI